ncbi:MAG: caspase family protein [Anaerolineales bacterium]
MASKFALVIANTEYTDPGLAQLTAPGRDAKELGRVLDSPDICSFDDVITLINENASKVGETIDYFFSLKKPDDLLIMYFSGHGVRDENGSLYLAVKNTNRARLRSTAIKADFIREAMDQSRSRRQVLILDCCNSGAFAQGTKAETGGSVGTARAFEGTGYGRVVLTASDSTQFAWEGDKVIGEETSNSLFTHFLVKGLDGDADQDWDGKITVDELYDYAYEEVVLRTPKQTPGKWSYRQQGDIFLRENLKPRDVKPAPLPSDLLELVTHPNSSVRKAGIQELVALLDGKHLGLTRSAQEKLSEIAATDDSLTLRQTAGQALSAHGFEFDQSMPIGTQKEKLIEKPSASLRKPRSLHETFSPLVKRVKGWILFPKLLEQKLVVYKLDKRLLTGILGIVVAIVFLGWASKLIFNSGSILASTPTATITPTHLATFTSSPTTTITPSLSRTVSPTPTLTPTSTRTLIPLKPTRKPRDPADTPVPPP